MEFFDRKEEVIGVELTQFGKHLLSVGKFKPAQYAFFDDDILYDIKYSSTGSASDGGFDSTERSHIYEKQNVSETRIKETPRIKTQYNFSDLEKRTGAAQSDYQTDCGPRVTPIEMIEELYEKLFEFGTEFNFVVLNPDELHTINLQDLVESGTDTGLVDTLTTLLETTHAFNNFNIYSSAASIANCLYQKRLSDIKYYPYIFPLGNSSLNKDYAPAWSVKFLNGDLLSEDPYDSVAFYSGSNFPQMKIPQLETRIQYDTYVAKVGSDGLLVNNYAVDDVGFFGEIRSDKFKDDTIIQVKSDYLFLEVNELNTDFLKDNFEIEVFAVEEKTDDAFPDKINREFKQLYFFNPGGVDNEPKPYHVEYYFDLLVDEEIESKFYCKSKNVDKKQNILSDQKIPFNCDDAPTPQFENIYKIEVKAEDFEEPC